MKKIYFLDDQIPIEQTNLLAIHCSLEAYQLAFEINKLTGSQFRRTKNDIDLPQKNAFYARYEWVDPKTDHHYDFFTNIYKDITQDKASKSFALFEQPIVKEVYLLPELYTVNYFIKTNHLEQLRQLKNTLNQLNAISLVYIPPTAKVKNHLNLIFD